MQNLNKKNKDGSVNSYEFTSEPGHGYYVEFKHPDFQTQIEENILPTVLDLNSKGYKTITSCHGHSLFNYWFRDGIRANRGPQVTVEVLNDDVEFFLKKINSLFVTAEVNNTITVDALYNTTYISIRPRLLIGTILPNKLLCNLIKQSVEKI